MEQREWYRAKPDGSKSSRLEGLDENDLVFPEISFGEYLLDDLALLVEPDPTMIESLYRVTNRERDPWDAETLLILAITRASMQQRATDKDCEQPYTAELSTEQLEDKNESVVGSFFKRIKAQNG